MSGLMERLADYAQDKPETIKDSDAFSKLEQTCSNILKTHVDMHAADVIEMYVAMLHFTANVYPERLDYVNGLMSTCFKVSIIIQILSINVSFVCAFVGIGE